MNEPLSCWVHAQAISLMARMFMKQGAHVEDRIVLSSNKGFTTAASSMKYLKGGLDTFFNRWPVPLVPIGALKTAKVAEYDAMFVSDNVSDRLPEDACIRFQVSSVISVSNGFSSVRLSDSLGLFQELGQEGDMVGSDMVKEDECIPFPHECHQVLTQELMHVFGAGVLVTAGVGSGLSILGALLSGGRVVALCASRAHMKFCQANVQAWLKEKKVVPGTTLPKPAHLTSYQQKKQRVVPKPPAPKPPPPTPNGSPNASGSPGNVGQGSSPGSGNGAGGSGVGGPGKNLLSAFGTVTM